MAEQQTAEHPPEGLVPAAEPPEFGRVRELSRLARAIESIARRLEDYRNVHRLQWNKGGTRRTVWRGRWLLKPWECEEEDNDFYRPAWIAICALRDLQLRLHRINAAAKGLAELRKTPALYAIRVVVTMVGGITDSMDTPALCWLNDDSLDKSDQRRGAVTTIRNKFRNAHRACETKLLEAAAMVEIMHLDIIEEWCAKQSTAGIAVPDDVDPAALIRCRAAIAVHGRNAKRTIVRKTAGGNCAANTKAMDHLKFAGEYDC